MSMSKKDFIALADIMIATHAAIEDDFSTPQIKQGRFEEWQRIKIELAAFCGRQNPRFNNSRWLSYIAGDCGPNGGEVKRSKAA